MTVFGYPSASLARIAAFAVIYFAITSLTVGATRFGGGLALVWFGTAVAAARLVTLPRRHWPLALAAIMVASALATTFFGFGPRMAAPLAVINAAEAWLVARLLVFARPRHDWLDNVSGVSWMIAVGGILAPAIAATAGGYAASTAAPGGWAHHAASWWAAHGLGTLIGFPLALLASRARFSALRERWSQLRVLELAGLLALVGAVAAGSLLQDTLPLLFLPIVPLLLAAFRGGRMGAVLGMLVVAGVTGVALRTGSGPVARFALDPAETALFLQFYLATISLLAIPMSVALRQHRLVLAELEERKALKGLVADHSDDALLNLDHEGVIRFASPAGARLSGEDELVGLPLTRFFDPLDELLVRGLLAQAAAIPGETCVLERPVLRGDEQLWLEAKLRAVAGPGRTPTLHGFAVTVRDVTTRKHAELDAIQASETDPLTGLANRRALVRRLERTLAHADQRPFALAILDLDHFKAINDSHGHPAGDEVLREVAAAMRRLSGPGRFFARLGGEEFALVGAQPDFAAAQELCEALRREIAAMRFVTAEGTRFQVTVSIGLARIARRSGSAEAMQVADTLLYRAKHAGRNRVEVSPTRPLERASRRAA